MYKLSIEKTMDGNNYILKHRDQDDHYTLYIKGLEFYNSDYIPKKGDIINISEELLNNNVDLRFEYIDIESDDCIKVISEDKEMYFKRLYE